MDQADRHTLEVVRDGLCLISCRNGDERVIRQPGRERMLHRERCHLAGRRRARVTGKTDVRSSEPVGCQDLSQGVLAIPTGVLRMHLSMTPEAVDKVADVEGVGCRENQPTTRVQMSTNAPKESSNIVEVLNQLTREDHVELPV